MTSVLLQQLQAFGLLGACLNSKIPEISAGNFSKILETLVDPSMLKSMNASKIEMDDKSWVWERRLDISDLNRFIVNRIQPCTPLFQLADRNGDAPPNPDHPLLYQTNGWPDGAPPAGRLHQAATFGWCDLLTSHITMLRLQLDRSKPVGLVAMWTGNKLIRAALWIVKTEGFLAAIDYLFSLMDHGLVIESDGAVWAFCRLFWTRRQVADDADLPGYLLQDANLDMAAWRSADFKLPLPGAPVRELSDDIDLAIEKVEERERLARAAPDCDSWLLAYARLGLAARVTHTAMRITGVADQFGYASYAARFEEFCCDVQPFFGAFLKDGAAERPGLALSPNWGIAASFTLIAKQEGEAWLRHMLEERVVLPNALTPAFLEAPSLSIDAPGWQRPSPRLSRILAHLVYRDIPIERHGAINGDAKTTAMVAGCFREGRHPDLTDLADRASAIWPLFYRNATVGPPSHDDDGEIFLSFLLYLSVQMPTDREEAKAWLDCQHLEWSDADLARGCEAPVEPGSRSDHEARLRTAERFIADYPYNGQVRVQHALRQYECGMLWEARRTVEEALMLDPGTEHIWAAASLICNVAGLDEDDRVAFAMTRYLEASQAG